MAAASSIKVEDGAFKKRRYLSVAAICLIVTAVSVLSITDGSMWFDEICRVMDPISGDLRATLKTAMGYAQPGYMLYMFLWARLGGTTEYFLRCSNLPFAAMALFYVFRIVKAKGWSVWWCLAFFIHPMFAYYMDEATPYIIVYALSLALIYYTYFAPEPDSTGNITKINGIYLLGVFVHFMFGFIIVLYFMHCLFVLRKEGKRPILRHAAVMACFSPAYLALLYLYARCLGKTQTGFGWKSILYIPYSFLGMQGAGLSRNDLRAGNFDQMQFWNMALLGLFAVVLLALAALVLLKEKRVFREERELLMSLAAYFAVIFAVAAVVKMGLWERHCMTAFPVYLICMCDVLHDLWGRRLPRFMIACYFILLVVSAGNIVYNYYYSCDDIKGATEQVAEHLAEDPQALVIDTQGDGVEKRYYSYVEAASDPDGQVVNMMGAADEDVIERMGDSLDQDPILILFEKNCSRYLYHYYDDDPTYQVDERYNSFRLVTFR